MGTGSVREERRLAGKLAGLKDSTGAFVYAEPCQGVRQHAFQTLCRDCSRRPGSPRKACAQRQKRAFDASEYIMAMIGMECMLFIFLPRSFADSLGGGGGRGDRVGLGVPTHRKVTYRKIIGDTGRVANLL